MSFGQAVGGGLREQPAQTPEAGVLAVRPLEQRRSGDGISKPQGGLAMDFH